MSAPKTQIGCVVVIRTIGPRAASIVTREFPLAEDVGARCMSWMKDLSHSDSLVPVAHEVFWNCGIIASDSAEVAVKVINSCAIRSAPSQQ